MEKGKTSSNKKKSFWQMLKEFFIVSEKDLKDWKKKNYVSRQQMRRTSAEEDEEYDREYERKNRRY